MSQENAPAAAEEKIDWWTHDRVMKEISLPYRSKATLQEIYGDGDKPDFQKLKKIFFEEGRLEDEVVLKILDDATLLFKKEPNMVIRDAPITICGDVHGQYYDLLKLLEIGGDPATTGYIFLGDYVDRGCFSCECVLLLWAIKINYSSTFTLLRGNHECKHLTEYFTFKNECLKKYNKVIYDKYLESFNTLPIAACVNKQFLCIHGGLSPEITVLDDFKKIDRFQEPPSFGAFCDILWADPIDKYGSERKDESFVHNPVRGCSYYFTYNACSKFLDNNKLLSVVRAHEAQDTGYRMYKKSSTTGFPSLITIFSAPNYLDVYNNGAAILKYENNVLNIRQFKHSPHPYWLPNFMNVFTWSIPFVGEKIMEILEAILKIASDEADEGEAFNQGMTRKDIVKNKIRAVGRMSRLFGILREENESVLMLKGLIPNGALPVGFLAGGRETITRARQKMEEGADHESIFEEIRKLDLINERRPPDADEQDANNVESKVDDSSSQ